MIYRLLLALAVLLIAGSAVAQTDDWALAQRDKDAIGIIEVQIGIAGLQIDNVPAERERGTGVIISGAGHVLTAAHLISPENYTICANALGSASSKQCRISFLWRGDRANRFELAIASDRTVDRDYIVLKLPPASSKIQRPTWPFVTLARRAVDGEAIYITGYPGSDPPQIGAADAIDTIRGSLRGDRAASCSNSYGIARVATGVTSPGLSGGPTFNRLHRVVGILLGKACPGDGSGSIEDAPRSRVLLVEDMTRLCQNPGFACFYGHDGDLDATSATEPKPWYKLLVGGEEVADRYVYGWKMREMARLVNFGPLCTQLTSDTQLVQSIQSDADDGAQLAVVYAAFWAVCRPGANSAEAFASRQRAERLAEAGYVPAQYFIAATIMWDLAPKLMVRQSPSDPLTLSASERESVARAEKLYRSAAENYWSAASLALFNLCTTRVVRCRPEEAGRFLDAALAEGQRDAVRVEAVARLIGNTDTAVQRFGFVRQQDTARALALLRQAANPLAGASRNPTIYLYDNWSAGYLAYFYWGGLYRGQALTDLSPMVAQQYGQVCTGGAFGMNPISEFCGMIEQVGRFNAASDASARNMAWSFIQQFVSWALSVGPLARNLATWSSDGVGIDRISCELSDDLRYVRPQLRPPFRAGTAYCYFPNPNRR